MSKLLKIYPAVLLLVPLAASAVEIDDVINKVTTTLENIIAALFVLATVIFLWGVIKFIAASGDPAGREKAKGIMFWGILGLAVMAAAWGVARLLIVYVLQGQNTTPTFIPPPSF